MGNHGGGRAWVKGVGPVRGGGGACYEWAGFIAIWGGAYCSGVGLAAGWGGVYFYVQRVLVLSGMGGVCAHSGDFRDGDRHPGETMGIRTPVP